MPSREITTIDSKTWNMVHCPVLELSEDEDGYELIPCDERLVVVASREIVGDDYGSWPVFSVQFQCGHTFDEMVNSLRNDEYV